MWFHHPKLCVDIFDEWHDSWLQINLNPTAAVRRVVNDTPLEFCMLPNKVIEVAREHVLMVSNDALGQGHLFILLTSRLEILDEEEIESLVTDFVRLSTRTGLRVHPLEVKGALLK